MDQQRPPTFMLPRPGAAATAAPGAPRFFLPGVPQQQQQQPQAGGGSQPQSPFEGMRQAHGSKLPMPPLPGGLPRPLGALRDVLPFGPAFA